ncbi:hypothetical protein J6590_068958 [Homalodisca vitripennis]|nr:hypothetical protein J6590_068958 [Homalodisca vitripennis]
MFYKIYTVIYLNNHSSYSDWSTGHETKNSKKIKFLNTVLPVFLVNLNSWVKIYNRKPASEEKIPFLCPKIVPINLSYYSEINFRGSGKINYLDLEEIQIMHITEEPMPLVI